jgi:hypothetical protein
MTKKYISNGEWFDKGTEAELLFLTHDDGTVGLFRGIKDGHIDEEQCFLEEFEITEVEEINEPNP